MKTILDYIIDQAERNDKINLSIELDVRDKFVAIYKMYSDRIINISALYSDMNNYARVTTLLYKIEDNLTMMCNDMYRLLTPNVDKYQQRGHMQTGDLITLGMEVKGSMEQKLSEIKGTMYDPNTYENMTQHAFENVTGLRDDLKAKMRKDVEQLFKDGKYDKYNVMSVVTKHMEANESRADMIAQTEMSMAYNHGVLQRMDSFTASTGITMYKYWHGFKYSEVTCTYCRPRIGEKYHIHDHTETLPAHPRCRCIWIPMAEGWDKPISMDVMRNADMLKRVYNPDEVYNKINKRLDINYAEYLDVEDATAYIAGKRSKELADKFELARNTATSAVLDGMNVKSDSPTKTLKEEYETQMPFWKKYVASRIVDNDIEELEKTAEAIKGVMVLPWSGQQLGEFNKLLEFINTNLKDND